jgi:hypothetical protein
VQNQHLVARVNGLRPPDPLHMYAEMVITMNVNGNRQVIYASNGVYRDQCSYELYFGSWTCSRPRERFYVTVRHFCIFSDKSIIAQLKVYTQDYSGATLQRTTTGICSAGKTRYI